MQKNSGNGSSGVVGGRSIYNNLFKEVIVEDENEENCNVVPKPKWHDIRVGFDDSTPATGQVLCSFVVAREKVAMGVRMAAEAAAARAARRMRKCLGMACPRACCEGRARKHAIHNCARVRGVEMLITILTHWLSILRFQQFVVNASAGA